MTAEDRTRLETETTEAVRREMADRPSKMIDVHVRLRLRALKRERMNGLSENEFRAHRSFRALKRALFERHGGDLGVVPQGIAA